MNGWVLVVDDDVSNLKVASRVLSEEGYRVSGVKSGAVALDFLRGNLPDLILLDVHMPEMGGFETLRRIREREELEELPVIFLTADMDTETEVKGYQAGVVDFIRKPFVPEILLQRTGRAIRLEQLQKLTENGENKQQLPRILIADDSDFDRIQLKRILEEKYEVVEATNGEEAIQILRESEGDFQLVISDLMMPGKDGLDVLDEIKQNPRYRSIPTLIATADENSDSEIRCLEKGCWNFVKKPYNPQALQRRVTNALERKKNQDQKEQHLTDTLSHYVDPNVVPEVLNERQAMFREGKQMEITLLAADIRNFTRISEKLEPARVCMLLNECLSLASSSIKKYGGTIDKFIGDCVMAYWGAPITCDDMAYRACQAAIEMKRMLQQRKAYFQNKYQEEIAMGVGIHMGQAIVGNIGCPERMDYTAVGDTVNTAFRVEGVARPNEILISKEVAETVGTRARVKRLETKISLKGKKNEIELFVLEELIPEE